MTETQKAFDILIIGGGTAGITVAAQLRDKLPESKTIAVIEPSDDHFYQPLWTLVGAGICDLEETRRTTASVMPRGVTWIQDWAQILAPDENTVKTRSGDVYTYKYLVVAAGIQINWELIKGAKKFMGKGGVCSNYAAEYADFTWDAMKNVKSGNAIFTAPGQCGAWKDEPAPTIKCPGAPQKIMWLAEEYFRMQGVRNDVNVIAAFAGERIFGIPKYRVALEKLVEARDIQTPWQHNLIEILGDTNEAVFEYIPTGEHVKMKYSMLHVVPPMHAPGFISMSPLADEAGWVDVDQYTTQHNRYPNVFSLGDASSLPTSKTGAAIRKEAPVLVANLLSEMEGRKGTKKYNGYTSCPLVTSRSRCILAEFGYEGEVMESFPFDQAQERYSMYLLKRHALPELYWHGMLKGRA